MARSAARSRSPRVIARQMALGFGTVSIVALAMGAALLSIINDVSNLVSGMRHDEHAIRQGFDLATAVREQVAQVAHALIQDDAARLTRYRGWERRVQSRLREVSVLVSQRERWRVRALAGAIQHIDNLFNSALPGAGGINHDAVRRAQQQIESLGNIASQHADALARAVESRMAHAHVLATDATRAALLVAGACVLLVIALSIAFTLRLRAAVLKPLVVLTNAAQRFGRGEFDSRVGVVGKGELAALGQAFDRMAEELALREARLIESGRMAAIGQLAAGIAHELNNPIGIIRGYLKTMAPQSDPRMFAEELAIIDEEAAHCERIAADLLAYARAYELTLERISMQVFLEQTARRLRESPIIQGRVLEVHVEDAEVEADSARLRQVVLNLLLNAFQASPVAEPVMLAGMLDGDVYCIAVEDYGSGIDPIDRQRVFEPFFSRRRGGSGLGLSVALGIVQAHRGTIDIEDGSRGGTRFTIRLPRYRTDPWRPE